MPIILDGTSGITTPEIVSTGGPLVVNASAPDNSVVVDASGNVGIGTGSPSARLDVRRADADGLIAEFHQSSGFGVNIGSSATVAFLEAEFNQALAFRTGSTATERMRIDSSGNLLVGTTSAFTAAYTGVNAVQISNVGDQGYIAVQTTQTASRDAVQFINPNGVVGSIRTGASSTSYNTSSDYRLKHDIQPMTGALAKVAALKPCTYKWNADNSIDEGFIAHELQEVCPSAVSGEKDAVETYTDEDGVEQTRINPQGIDTSFLVATLTAAIQELKAINDAQAQTIESLTARVVALEQA